MDNSFLEQYYENVILPQYGGEIAFKKISWKDHGKIGLDAWAHYFEDDQGREYVLVYEDFPGDTFLDDGLTHEVIPLDNETTVHTTIQPGRQMDNVIGYFTLYREKISHHAQA